MKQKNIWIIFANLFLFMIMLFEMTFCLSEVEWFVQILAYTFMVVFTFGSFITFLMKKEALIKSCFTLNLITFIVITFFTILNLCGLFDDFSDMEKIKKIILDAGSWGYIIYMALQIVNVIILPIPGAIIILAGLAIFGPVKTFIITYISTIIGCLIAFAIGKYFGQKAVIWCVGEENTKKYKEVIGKKGNFLFFVMQLFPVFPDDILCMVVGLTPMKFSFFILCIMFTKAIGISLICFFGSGSLIPFSGWGIPVWIAICVLTVTGFVLFCKYQKQIEKWLKKLLKKNKNSEKLEELPTKESTENNIINEENDTKINNNTTDEVPINEAENSSN